MAHRKLRLEVELDTAKAKRQKRDLEADTPGASGAAFAGGTSSAADRASRQIRELGDAAQGTKVNMKEVTRAFTGMAVGMAATYAAKSMKPGAARTAVEYGGAAMAGAYMGKVAGPGGMAVGALVGLLKTYIEKEGTKAKATEDFMRGEHDYADARAFKKMIENLTETGDAFEMLQTNIGETRSQLEHYRAVEEELIAKVKKFRQAGDEDSAKLEEGYLGQNRTRQEVLENVLKGLEKQQKAEDASLGFSPRASFAATDSLAKIGGVSSRAADISFTGGGADATNRAIQSAAERSARVEEEMLTTLKTIADNTEEGETWQ